MARGWESKAVEAQQAEAFARTPAAAQVSPADAERRARRATLVLARARAEADLRSATAAAHREMLARAIAELDRQIQQLG